MCDPGTVGGGGKDGSFLAASLALDLVRDPDSGGKVGTDKAGHRASSSCFHVHVYLCTLSTSAHSPTQHTRD